MTGVIDLVDLRNRAIHAIDGKSSKENTVIRFRDGQKVEVIGGPQYYTFTGVPKEHAIEIVYQFLLKQENDRIDEEEKQWRGG